MLTDTSLCGAGLYSYISGSFRETEPVGCVCVYRKSFMLQGIGSHEYEGWQVQNWPCGPAASGQPGAQMQTEGLLGEACLLS